MSKKLLSTSVILALCLPLFFQKQSFATAKTFPTNYDGYIYREFFNISEDEWNPSYVPVLNVHIIHTDLEGKSQNEIDYIYGPNCKERRRNLVKEGLRFWEIPKGVLWIASDLSLDFTKIQYVAFIYFDFLPADIVVDWRNSDFFITDPRDTGTTVGRASLEKNTIFLNGEVNLIMFEPNFVSHEFGHIINMAHNNDIASTYAGDTDSNEWVTNSVMSIMFKKDGQQYSPVYDVDGKFMYNTDDLILIEEELGPPRTHIQNYINRIGESTWGYMPAWTWPGKWPFSWNRPDGPYDDIGDWIVIERGEGDPYMIRTGLNLTKQNFEFHSDVVESAAFYKKRNLSILPTITFLLLKHRSESQ